MLPYSVLEQAVVAAGLVKTVLAAGNVTRAKP